MRAALKTLKRWLGEIILLVTVALYIFTLKDDISRAQVSQNHSPEVSGTYLVSYADGYDVFLQNQNVLTSSALNKGIDFFLSYRKQHLDPQFMKANASIFEQKKGAGFWLWKPWVIMHTLERTPENALIFYADSGVVFIRPIHELIAFTKYHDMIFVGYNVKDVTLGANSKREALIQLQCDTQACREAQVLGASFMILKNTAQTRNFIKKWLEACCNESILTDRPSSQPEHPEFVKHFHDQTLLGILFYKDPPKGALVVPEEFLSRYVAWPHRHPQSYDRPHSIMNGPAREHDSVLPYLQEVPYFRVLQEILLNNSIVVGLRKRILSR